MGQVAGFRLKFDRETGKPKGFGFCDYHDVESAASARRNLNNVELNGRRLRVGSATGVTGDTKAPAVMPVTNQGLKRQRVGAGRKEDEKTAAVEQVSGVVASMTPAQVYEIVASMKDMVDANPEQARALLISNPQLAYAVLESQVLLNMAPQLVAIAEERKLKTTQANQIALAQEQEAQLARQRAAQQREYSEADIQAAFASVPEETRSIYMQVLALREDDIAQLPATQQQQVLMLRQQAMALLSTV